MYSPFGMNTARRQAGLYSPQYQPQYQQQSPYDFKGLETRLGQIETGIAGLTDQFKNFQMPGQETPPDYTGNTAPDPLDPVTPPGGIPDIPPPSPLPGGPVTAGPPTFGPGGPPGGDPGGIIPPGSDQTVPGGGGLESLPEWTGVSPQDWIRDYEFDMAPQISADEWSEYDKTRPQYQPGGMWNQMEHRQDFQKNWQENNPEWQRWNERNEARGDVSTETQEIMRGGQNMWGDNSISPYIRGGGGGYEDYLSEIERRKNMPKEDGGRLLQRIKGPSSPDFVQGGPQQMPNRIDQIGQPTAQAYSRSYHDPTRMMGGENYQTLSEEEYGRQSDLWGKHLDFRNFAQTAQQHLAGSGQSPGGIWKKMGPGNPAFGHAFENWQQFNQGQTGGAWERPETPSLYMNQPPRAMPMTQPQPGSQVSLNNPQTWQGLGAGIGALTGPTQQKIQGYMT